ncbi:MAG: hypothetical protein ACI9FJ_003261 [Alteromonadaceae bacterium]|jgi:hypothetical protein
MPITDGWLAYEAQAPAKVVVKHGLTIVYLFIIFFGLKKLVSRKDTNKVYAYDQIKLKSFLSTM